MATGGPDILDAYTRYSRIVLVLGKTCTELERAVLEKYLSLTGDTLDQFLQHNKSSILKKRTGKHNEYLYFPVIKPADVHEWDLGAVCLILTDFTKVPQQLKDDIVHLRQIRNKICHGNNTDLEELDYLSHRADIQIIIDRALNYINDGDFNKNITKQIQDIEQGAFTATVHNCVRQMNAWCMADRELELKVDQLNEDNKITHQRLEKLFRLLEDDRKQQVEIPDCTVDLEMQKCSESQETDITNQFIEHFNDCIKESRLRKRLADEDLEELKQVVHNTFKKLKTVKAMCNVACSPASTSQSLATPSTSAVMTHIGKNALSLKFHHGQQSDTEKQIYEGFIGLSHILPKSVGIALRVSTTTDTHRAIEKGKAYSSKTMVGMRLVDSGKICVKSSRDKMNVRVTGIDQLDNNMIILTDCNNNAVKIVNTNRKEITDYLTLTSKPWDLAVVPDRKAAVTIPTSQKIQFMSTDGSLKEEHSFNVGGRCQGICCVDESIVVTFAHVDKVEIINLHGEVMKTITSAQSGSRLFSRALYVTSIRTGNDIAIYVTSFDRNTIIKLSKDGQILDQYTDENLNLPLGIAGIGNGRFAVCNHKTGIISGLHDDGNTIQNVCQWECVKRPQALLCQDNTLFVCCESMEGGAREHIHLYTLKEN